MDDVDILISFPEMAGRMALACLCGGILGFEREWHGKPAGLRTHMMVALGAATFAVATFQIFHAMDVSKEGLGLDPLRLVEGLVGGIGFLGAGTIIRGRGEVEGITTAASIWLVGALGLACGVGSYQVALLTLGFAVAILVAVGFLERRLLKDRRRRRRRIVEPESADEFRDQDAL